MANIAALLAAFGEHNGAIEVGLVAAADVGLTAARYIKIPHSMINAQSPIHGLQRPFNATYQNPAASTAFVKRTAAGDAQAQYRRPNSDIAMFRHAQGGNVAYQAVANTDIVLTLQTVRDFIFLNMPGGDYGSNTWRLLSVACRLVIVRYNWLKVGAECEWEVVDTPNVAGVPIGPVQVSDESVVTVLSSESKASNLLVAAALNFWQTNHHVGQAELGGIIRKTLIQMNMAPPADQGARSVTRAIYDGVHAVNIRAILAMIHTSVLTGNFDAHFGTPMLVVADTAFALRATAFPAGTHKVTTIWVGLSYLVNSHLALALPSRGELMALRNARNDAENLGPGAHQGFRYLLQPAVDAGIILGVGNGFNQNEANYQRVSSEIAQAVRLLYPTTTLARSPAIIALSAQAPNAEWQGICTAARAAQGGGVGAAQVQAMLNVVGGVSGDWNNVFADGRVQTDAGLKAIVSAVFIAQEHYSVYGVLPAGFAPIARNGFPAGAAYDALYAELHHAAPNATV